jgi:hypothetical protein
VAASCVVPPDLGCCGPRTRALVSGSILRERASARACSRAMGLPPSSPGSHPPRRRRRADPPALLPTRRDCDGPSTRSSRPGPPQAATRTAVAAPLASPRAAFGRRGGQPCLLGPGRGRPPRPAQYPASSAPTTARCAVCSPAITAPSRASPTPHPRRAAALGFTATPVIHGTTRDEHRTFQAGFELFAGHPATDAQFREQVQAEFGKFQAARVLARYRQADYPSPSLALATCGPTTPGLPGPGHRLSARRPGVDLGVRVRWRPCARIAQTFTARLLVARPAEDWLLLCLESKRTA